MVKDPYQMTIETRQPQVKRNHSTTRTTSHVAALSDGLASSFVHGSNSRTPSEHPNPTTKNNGSNMGGDFTYQPTWDPQTVLTTAT